jgi:HTH-type transcriptional regulator / antitoxin HigA
MKTLKYTVIKNKTQYNRYCDILEDLLQLENTEDEIDLLTVLVEKWDSEHNIFDDYNPVELTKALMKENNLKSKDLAEILDLSRGTISKILNYQKGFSKNTIRKLSEYFKISQEAFNKSYQINNSLDFVY